jgi:hypothetical protein
MHRSRSGVADASRNAAELGRRVAPTRVDRYDLPVDESCVRVQPKTLAAISGCMRVRSLSFRDGSIPVAVLQHQRAIAVELDLVEPVVAFRLGPSGSSSQVAGSSMVR